MARSSFPQAQEPGDEPPSFEEVEFLLDEASSCQAHSCLRLQYLVCRYDTHFFLKVLCSDHSCHSSSACHLYHHLHRPEQPIAFNTSNGRQGPSFHPSASRPTSKVQATSPHSLSSFTSKLTRTRTSESKTYSSLSLSPEPKLQETRGGPQFSVEWHGPGLKLYGGC